VLWVIITISRLRESSIPRKCTCALSGPPQESTFQQIVPQAEDLALGELDRADVLHEQQLNLNLPPPPTKICCAYASDPMTSSANPP
jgi:hypothetical protein